MLGEQPVAFLAEPQVAVQPAAVFEVGRNRKHGQHRRREIELEKLHLRAESAVDQLHRAMAGKRRAAADQRQQRRSPSPRRAARGET